ncbi:MAG: HAMP domain-containing histidine kinase [Planctomycetia bacterium]|nr:HAMP domain-containing histidine kinase [Planctomycetia bacterium]
MRLLPNLVAAAGVITLPLSDRSAEHLVAALLTQDAAERLEQFREALEHDAPFALWAVCRAAQAGCAEIRTAGDLAAWLSDQAVTQLCRPADEDVVSISAGEVEKWADLAAFSLAVAKLSARIAEAVRLDQQRARFLGLLHAARQWGGPSQPQWASFLPSWLVDELAAMGASQVQRPSSAADCVALAIEIVNHWPAVSGRTLDVDPQDFLAQRSEASQTWLQSLPKADLLRPLIDKLARMESLERQFQKMLETEKLESLKELAYGAGHEINNPLANISARAQTLLEEERDPERRRKLSAINTQAFRAHEMIADMMLFARPPLPKRDELDLAPLVSELFAELAATAAEQQTQLVWTAPAKPVIAWADKTQIAVAVRALCVNALEALVTGGRVEVALSTIASSCHAPAGSCPSRQTVQITVSDNGPGISSEVRRHIFDPFYSGREAGRGLGFGLSKCWRIVTLHGGLIDVDSAPGEGARFTITLPADNNR